MRLKDLENKKILIVGYGKEGQSTYQFLKNRLTNSQVDYTDQTIDKNYLSRQIGYDLAIKTPGINPINMRIPYTTATNIFFANVQNQVIGVTGSKGKSTVSSLIYWIFSRSGYKTHLCGNIGQPMLTELQKRTGDDEIFVCELSSFQLVDINYSPHIAVILNLFPEHMDFHGGVENYYQAKKNIFKFSNKSDYLVYNQQSSILKKWASEAHCQTISFTDQPTSLDSTFSLIGHHNIENIKAAITVAKLYQIPDEKIYASIRTFKPLPHRLEVVGDYGGVKYIDDAISTTPESTIAAINSFEKIGTLFLGGTDRGYDFLELVKVIQEKQIKNLVLFPDTGAKIRLLLSQVNYQANFFETRSMEQAVQWAVDQTPTNSVCLLSCASPSYSLWKNFEEKGELFSTCVKKYAA